MDKFIKKAAEEGITSKAIEEMVQRDIEYKNDIYRKIDHIRTRQIITIIIGSVLMVLMAIVILRITDSIEGIDNLIKALLYSTQEM